MQPNVARRAVDVVADLLRKRILDSEYAPGTRMPAERQLAESLGVNRLTLRAAIARLESEGFVHPRQGDGLVVLDWKRTADIAIVRYLVGDDRRLLAPFLELRRAIAAEAVALATARASEADIAKIEALAEAQDAEDDDTEFARRDLEIGRAVLRAAKNLPMELLLNTIEHIYWLHPELITALHADRDAVRGSYRAVVALLRNRDAELARTSVRSALEEIDKKAIARLKRSRK